ncbi:MAG: LysR substrate-binding domain-containing protein [Polaromonas sp.]|nr:LysR substrate-binding domain-containing protein [Polaromonas sp.]
MNLSGRLVDAFLVLEETRRFATAAQRCHMSPSAFSQMIGRLEEQVGARLFDRDTRNVKLTPEGEVFSQGAHRISADMKSTLAEVRDRVQRRVGRISVAAPPSLAASWLPAQLARYHASYPAIRLKLFDEPSHQCLKMVARGEVDFGLSTLSGPDIGIEATLLFNERHYVLCRTDHPFALRKSVSLRDMRNQNYISLVRLGVWQSLLPLLESAKVRDVGMEVNQIGTLAGLVAAGFGISLVPVYAMELCRRNDLVGVPFSAANSSRPIFIIRRERETLSAAASAFYDNLLVAGKGLTL